MNIANSATLIPTQPNNILSTISQVDVMHMMDRYQYSETIRQVVVKENLLPAGVLSRLHASYPQHSGFLENKPFLFNDRDSYTGLKGYRRVVKVLEDNGIDLGFTKERELFVEVYRFLATPHSLNSIDLDNYATDSVFQLVFPQLGMIVGQVVVKLLGRMVGRSMGVLR